MAVFNNPVPILFVFALLWHSSVSFVSRRSSSSSTVRRATADLSNVEINYGVVPPLPDLASWNQRKGNDLLVSSATTIAGVLAQIWSEIVDDRDKDIALLFPSCPILREPRMLEKLITHLETCKDVCERFGTSVVALAVDPRAPIDHPANGPAPGILLRFFGAREEVFGKDDDWDDDWDVAPGNHDDVPPPLCRFPRL
jgi:hypothetical protein